MSPLSDEQRDLFDSCFRLACQIACRFADRYPWIEREEMLGEAHLALALAAQRFDPGRGLKFTTLSYHAVTDALRELMRQFRRRVPTTSLDGTDPAWPEHEPLTAVENFTDANVACVFQVGPEIVGDKDWAILLGRSQGRTCISIGRDYGISKERIRQREKRANRVLRVALKRLAWAR